LSSHGPLTVSRLVVAALIVLGLMTAPAAAGAKTGSAQGQCELVGALTFRPPIGNEPVETRYRDRAEGTCDGTLNGGPVVDSPVVLRGRGRGTVGCLSGQTRTKGTLTYTRGTPRRSDDVVFRYIAHSTGALTQFLSVSFDREGEVSGVAHIDTLSQGDPSAFERCEAGTLTRVPYRATIGTLDAASR